MPEIQGGLYTTNDNRGYRRIAGAWGTVYINGEDIFEVEEVEANVEIQRGDVLVSNNVDSKITGLAGTGSLKVKHVYTRGIRTYLSELKAGHDPRFMMTIALSDPDAVGGQKERINIGNSWINNLPLSNFNRSEIVEKTYEFGFTPSDAEIAEGIY